MFDSGNDNKNAQQVGTGHNCTNNERKTNDHIGLSNDNYTNTNNKIDNIKEEQFISHQENSNDDIIVEKMLSPSEMKDEKTYNWNDL